MARPTQGSLSEVWYAGEDIQAGQVIWRLIPGSLGGDETAAYWHVFKEGQTYTERMQLGMATASATKGQRITVLIRGMMTGIVMNDAAPGEDVYLMIDPTNDAPDT